MQSQLAIFNATEPDQPPTILQGEAELAAKLESVGVGYERWPTRADSDNPLADYAAEIERLKSTHGFTTVDVVSLKPDHPQRQEFRQKFLAEHRHGDHEVRFFVQGNGLFFMHIGGEVLRMLCVRGDLISVPANMTHWFDMGDAPDFTAIRLFTDPEGWVADFTGDDIASRFPYYGAADRPGDLFV